MSSPPLELESIEEASGDDVVPGDELLHAAVQTMNPRGAAPTTRSQPALFATLITKPPK
jgi:hypothetical protein